MMYWLITHCNWIDPAHNATCPSYQLADHMLQYWLLEYLKVDALQQISLVKITGTNWQKLNLIKSTKKEITNFIVHLGVFSVCK